jgi:AcrR family transcriptional regulator
MKPIDEPQNARSRRTASALLKAARELIEEGGVEALTMAAAAERAGVSRRAVYLHFGSRVDLINGLVDDLKGIGGLEGALRPVWESPDALAMLDEWARHIARFVPRIMSIVRAIERVSRTDPDAAQHWASAQRTRYGTCLRLMERLNDEKRLAPPWTIETGADMMLALSSFDVIETLLTDRGWSPDQVAGHLSSLFRTTFVGGVTEPVAE